MNQYHPAYLFLLKNGELKKRVDSLSKIYSSCSLCPWKCRINRANGELGRCKASLSVKVASTVAHFGEEPVISGSKGSGTIFFSHCNLRCCFCQNHEISHGAQGDVVSVDRLSEMMLELQEKGCHNINLVSPVHYLPGVIAAIYSAAQKGLCIPLVYNTNGYEDVSILRLLDGIVDIYLPDIKYSTDASAIKYSSAEKYSHISICAVKEMFHQTGCHLCTDKNNIAVKGTIVRLLVLPENLSGTEKTLKTLKALFGTNISISLMGQYKPCYNALKHRELSTSISREDYYRVVETLSSLGFENGWVQDWENLDSRFLPDFKKTNPWS
ncbi:MAG: radical SAM protein [Alphaproteobacteria bacterium]